MKEMEAPEVARFSRGWRALATTGGPAIVVVVAAFVYVALGRSRDAQEWVAHSRNVIAAAQTTFSAVQDAETGQRGYLITGDATYLAPYDRALAALRTDTAGLRALTQDNPRQQRRVDTLGALIQRRVSMLEHVIDARRAGGMPAATMLLRENRGKAVMDSIRALVGGFRSDEDSLLVTRRAMEDRMIRGVVFVLLFGTIVAVLIGVLINGLLTRYAMAQEASARLLADQNAQLQEQAVELEMQQQHLQEQTIELEAQAEQLEEQTHLLEGSNTKFREVAAVASSASAAKSEFLAAMSHELRTPLNAIDGYVDLLSMEVRGPVNEAQQEDLRRIKKSSRHLLSLINQILDLTRIEARQVDLSLAPVPVDGLLRDVEVLVAPQMQAKQITCTVEPCDATLTARIDADKVKQILLNLLSNAQKFTEAGGTVRVDCAVAAGTLRMRVTDSGRGVPADKLAVIFEPFVQLERRLTRENEQGVGLGLAISRDLARAMGGDLVVESVVGKGSTFTLTLPRDGNAAPSQEQELTLSLS
jgi:signal transduction histidine kinase